MYKAYLRSLEEEKKRNENLQARIFYLYNIYIYVQCAQLVKIAKSFFYAHLNANQCILLFK